MSLINSNSDDNNEKWKSSWPLGPYDCFFFQYKNKCMCIPYFIPMSICSTCCLLGRIRSKLVQEDICCCGMGEQGCVLCLISAPIAMVGPFGGCCWYAWVAAYIRNQVIDAYNIDDIYTNGSNCCCVPSMVSICYPCSLFQIYMTLLSFEQNADDFESPLI